MRDKIRRIIACDCGTFTGNKIIRNTTDKIVSVVKERIEELFDDDDLYNGVRIKQMFLESLDGKGEIVIKSPAERRKQALSKLRGVNEDESREKM